MGIHRPLSMILLVSGLVLVQAPGILAAGQRTGPPEIVPYGEMERFLSPTELQLAELQRERQDLLQERETEKNARILKNKITILNNKIAYLQRQLKITKPYMVSQRLVPVSVKGAADNAERLQAEEIPVAILPKKLESTSRIVPAVRENAVQAVLPLKISPRPFGSAAARETALAADIKTGGAKTGADWMKMARSDKEIYILSVMGNLSRRDVYLMKPYGFYIQAIDEAIGKDPALERAFVHRILMTSAYDSEPDSRKDLEKVWK